MPDNSIGAIWERTYEDTETLFIKIKIFGSDPPEYMEFMAYRNKYKKEDKHPTWKIYPKKKKEDDVPPF